MQKAAESEASSNVQAGVVPRQCHGSTTSLTGPGNRLFTKSLRTCKSGLLLLTSARYGAGNDFDMESAVSQEIQRSSAEFASK
jgi:hypothetical protein